VLLYANWAMVHRTPPLLVPLDTPPAAVAPGQR